MQDLTTAVLAALGGTLVIVGGYHLLIALPRMRALARNVATHDELLGGGAATPATQRVAGLEAAAVTARADAAAVVVRLDVLEVVARSETPRIGFIRFNAFDDVGSDQSYALALLTKEGDGVVLTSIYSREETRTYGKAVEKFQAAQDASREERAAILQAKAAAT